VQWTISRPAGDGRPSGKPVSKVEAVNLKAAYEATPGYGPQQSTLNTQRFFTLLIGILVLGGFFQIQTLQKVAQIGMLKAIGASNLSIAASFLLQIIPGDYSGCDYWRGGTFFAYSQLSADLSYRLHRESVLLALSSIMLIGPLGGLVSLRILLKVEPLRAFGFGLVKNMYKNRRGLCEANLCGLNKEYPMTTVRNQCCNQNLQSRQQHHPRRG